MVNERKSIIVEKHLAATESVTLLYRHIIEADRAEARRLLSAAAEGMGYNDALRNILEPTLRMVGERWASDGISLAQGFVAGKVAEDFLILGTVQNVLRHSAEAETAEDDGSRLPPKIAVLGNVEDDYHVLGRSMVASFLAIEGWNIVDLGCDVLAEEFVDRASEAGACVIGASAMMLTTARNIVKIRQVLEDRGLAGHLKLAVGGAVFAMRPDLVGEVGGDGTARTALEAPALFELLRKKAGRA